jgi:hypothetical protein
MKMKGQKKTRERKEDEIMKVKAKRYAETRKSREKQRRTNLSKARKTK